MKWAIIFLTIGIVSFVITGAIAENKKKISRVLFLFIACGIIFTYLGLYSYSKSYSRIPNGLPVELKTDGQYEVQPVDNYADDTGKKWVVVLVLQEGGKTIEGLKPYRKIPRSKFGSNNVVIGIPMTIELKTHPSYQELIVKKDN